MLIRSLNEKLFVFSNSEIESQSENVGVCRWFRHFLLRQVVLGGHGHPMDRLDLRHRLQDREILRLDRWEQPPIYFHSSGWPLSHTIIEGWVSEIRLSSICSFFNETKNRLLSIESAIAMLKRDLLDWSIEHNAKHSHLAVKAKIVVPKTNGPWVRLIT